MTNDSIEIYSDLICPWCYIAQQKLRDALKLLAGGPPTIHWKPYQLNPQMPVEGVDRKTYRTKKFGSWERSLAMDADVEAAGNEVGLEFHFERIAVTPNTFLGHRLLWSAVSSGRQDELAEALFRAYFSEGRDIGIAEVLAQIASEVGFEYRETLNFLQSEAGVLEVLREESAGGELGIQSVPFFILNNSVFISGAQSPEIFAQAINQVFAASIPERF